MFIPTIGEYVTPQLVGGPGGFMFGSAIQSAFTAGLDWQFGSAMAMFLDLRRRGAAGGLRPFPQRPERAPNEHRGLDGRRRWLWVDFWILVVFLYAPIVILLIF